MNPYETIASEALIDEPKRTINGVRHPVCAVLCRDRLRFRVNVVCNGVAESTKSFGSVNAAVQAYPDLADSPNIELGPAGRWRIRVLEGPRRFGGGSPVL